MRTAETDTQGLRAHPLGLYLDWSRLEGEGVRQEVAITAIGFRAYTYGLLGRYLEFKLGMAHQVDTASRQVIARLLQWFGSPQGFQFATCGYGPVKCKQYPTDLLGIWEEEGDERILFLILNKTDGTPFIPKFIGERRYITKEDRALARTIVEWLASTESLEYRSAIVHWNE